MKKLSFFERLTGTVRMDDEVIDSRLKGLDDESYPTQATYQQPHSRLSSLQKMDDEEIYVDEEIAPSRMEPQMPDEETEAELAVDVFHTERDITIQTMTAGIKKENLEIILSRSEITIRGRRDNPNNSYTNDFYIQELYWGPFSRTIQLPDEVAIDDAVAHEHHGLLTVKLPKFNKVRSVKLKAQ